MATETVKKKKGFRHLILVSILLIFSLLLTGCTEQQVEEGVDIAIDILLEALNPEDSESTSETQTEATQSQTAQTENSTSNSDDVIIDGTMEVHFIDVGQADATLIIQGEQVMIFDAATKSRGDELVEYIQNLGINYIDVVILSHPHDDHMGGAAKLLNSDIEVGKIYGPDIFELMDTADSPGWYDDMIEAVDRIDQERNPDVPEDQQISIWNFPRNSEGEFAKFKIGEATVEFYAPLEDEYSDKNDYSICAKVSFGTVDIMFTADATSAVERALLEKGYSLDVEIFQASHHGSDTGNSKEFLEAMSPDVVVISCGMKNKYNHPIKSVMELYEAMNIPVYRTDESGNIVMTTDGQTYSFNVEPGTYTSGAEYKKGN